MIALAAQLRAAHGGGRRDYSRRQGVPRRGAAYFFTSGMLPHHKESVRHHPLEFAVGAMMHLGALLALAGVLVMAVHPFTGVKVVLALRPLSIVALAAGIFLLGRRAVTRDLRAMSVPDDYLAMLATSGLLLLTALLQTGPVTSGVALAYTAAFLVYFPLGKLRHAVFFFAARGDYGRRLGYRGVLPPSAAEAD